MTNIKKCSKCGEEKPFEDFSPHAHGKHGLQARCKTCCAEANSARYRANIETEREKARLRAEEYRRTHPEEDRARKAAWREANKEKDKAAKRAWVLRNPKKKAEINAAWVEGNRERHNESGKRWKKNNPERMRVYHLRKYGLTPETFDAMLAAQEGRCAICHEVFSQRGPCIDHHHGSKKVRALLCVTCNAGLGHFRERPERLESAARYLRQHHGVLR